MTVKAQQPLTVNDTRKEEDKAGIHRQYMCEIHPSRFPLPHPLLLFIYPCTVLEYSTDIIPKYCKFIHPYIKLSNKTKERKERKKENKQSKQRNPEIRNNL